MINKLISTLLYPDMGEFALRLYYSLKNGELSLKIFSELITTLHRLSLCSYYEITDVDFGDVSCNYRYLDPGDLCDHGASFALLCLEKMVEDNKVEKQNTVIARKGYTLNVCEVIAKLELTAEKLGDEDELTADWINKLNAFVLWTPDNNHDFRIELLDIINPSNANVIFGYCTRYGRISLPDKLKEYQTKDPEDFFTFEDIREYHAQRTHSVFCHSFLERADSNEHGKVVAAQDKAKKALTIKELLLALTEEDTYLVIRSLLEMCVNNVPVSVLTSSERADALERVRLNKVEYLAFMNDAAVEYACTDNVFQPSLQKDLIQNWKLSDVSEYFIKDEEYGIYFVRSLADGRYLFVDRMLILSAYRLFLELRCHNIRDDSFVLFFSDEDKELLNTPLWTMTWSGFFMDLKRPLEKN